MGDPKTKKQEEPLVHSTTLDPVQLQTQGSRTWQWRQDYYEDNPYQDFASKERPLIPLKYKTDDQLRRRYEKAAINSIAKKLVETRGKTDRKNWMESLSSHEKEILANSKFSRLTKPTDWELAGGAARKVAGAYLPNKNQFKPDYLTDEEYNDIGPLDILAPADIPRKALVSAPMRNGYSMGDALSGVQDDSNLQEKAMTDPFNLVGIGLFSKINKFKGLTQTQKWGNAAVGYGRNVVGNAALDVVQNSGKGANLNRGSFIVNDPNTVIPNGMIDEFAKREAAWLNSEEYIRRNMAATGKTREAVEKERNAILERIPKTKINILDTPSPEGSMGDYNLTKENPFINVYKAETPEVAHSTLDHEIKHAYSQAALPNGRFSSQYDKYPKTNLLPWYHNFVAGHPKYKTAEWASAAPEQQVVSRRIMDVLERTQGVKRGDKLTGSNIKDLRELLVKEYSENNYTNSDIGNFFGEFKSKFGEEEYYKRLRDMVNKAYAISPIVPFMYSEKSKKIHQSNKP